MTNDTVHTSTYDAEGRMLTVDSGSTATYVYDAFGRCIEKTTASGSLVYLYDISGHEIAELDTSGNNVRDDIWAGTRNLAMYYSNSTYFFNADQVGTERVATDPTGAVAQTCINMPYGDDFSCTGSLPTGRFAGYDTNDEYALAHSPARYYSPALGRFMTPDPLSAAVPANPAGNMWVAQDVGLQAMGLLGARDAALDAAAQSEPGKPGSPLGPGYMSGGFVSRSMAGAATTVATLDPQSWNAFAYARGSACTLTDPTGRNACTILDVWTLALTYGALIPPLTLPLGIAAAVNGTFALACHLLD